MSLAGSCLAPLLCHRASDSFVSFAADLPAVFAGAKLVLAARGLIFPNSIVGEGQNVGWGEVGEVFEPQAGLFAVGMAVFPRLDDLVGFADAAGND